MSDPHLWPVPDEPVAGLRVYSGGEAGPVLLLVHGLGATAEVWTGVGALDPSTGWSSLDWREPF